MGEYQLIALAIVVALIGGTVAARITGIALWKGLVVAGVASVATLVAFFVPGLDRGLSMPLAALIGAGLSGAMLGLTAPATAHVLIGTAVPPMIGFLIMELSA
jgi:hypothetical protein